MIVVLAGAAQSVVCPGRAVKRDAHGGADALSALEQQRPAVQAGDLPRGAEPEAGAVPGGVEAVAVTVALEHRVQLVGRDAAAVVVDGEDQLFADAAQRYADACAALGVAEAVGQQVQHQHFEQLRRAEQRRTLGEGELDLGLREVQAHGVDQVAQQGAQLQRLGMEGESVCSRPVDDRQVLERPVDAEEVLLQAAQGSGGAVVPVAQPRLQQGGAHPELHQLAAQGAEKGLVHQLPGRGAGGEEERAQTVHRAQAQQHVLSADLRLADEGGRLHLCDLLTEQLLEAPAGAVRAQQQAGGIVCVQHLSAPDEQGGLPREGEQLGR